MWKLNGVPNELYYALKTLKLMKIFQKRLDSHEGEEVIYFSADSIDNESDEERLNCPYLSYV